MTKPIKIFLLGVLVIVLMLVRYLEKDLFYDPLLVFFKDDYTTQALPELQSGKLVLNVVFRYLINTLLSLAILWVLFKKREILKIASFLYVILFLILLIPYCYFVFYSDSQDYLPLFYIRRFLIQPIFLLIFIPAFYFKRNA